MQHYRHLEQTASHSEAFRTGGAHLRVSTGFPRPEEALSQLMIHEHGFRPRLKYLSCRDDLLQSFRLKCRRKLERAIPTEVYFPRTLLIQSTEYRSVWNTRLKEGPGIYVHICTYVYTYTLTSVSLDAHVCMYVCMCIYLYRNAHILTQVLKQERGAKSARERERECVCVCVYVCLCVCPSLSRSLSLSPPLPLSLSLHTYKYMYIYIYIHMCLYIYTHVHMCV